MTRKQIEGYRTRAPQPQNCYKQYNHTDAKLRLFKELFRYIYLYLYLVFYFIHFKVVIEVSTDFFFGEGGGAWEGGCLLKLVDRQKSQENVIFSGTQIRFQGGCEQTYHKNLDTQNTHANVRNRNWGKGGEGGGGGAQNNT